MSKNYYYISFTLVSPMSIGNGITILTDHDTFKDKNGLPVIPGTSIAGVISRYLTDEERILFSPKNGESEFFISDARCKMAKYAIRDGICLNDDKQTEDGAKYDFEVIEPGTKFSFRIETNSKNKKIIDKILNGFDNGDLILGYRANRGYGKIKINNVRIKEIVDFDLLFDKYNIDDYVEYDYIKTESKFNNIVIKLKQNSPLCIRKYTTDVSDNSSLPDFSNIKSNEKNVVPGTSWNGLIRHTINKYIKELKLSDNINEYFGFVNSKEKKSSQIIIEESILNNTEDVIITRNTIDRFSGSSLSTALYTESICVGGDTELVIKFKTQEAFDNMKKLIYIFIKDLSEGFVALGGETSIGRGLFKVKKIIVNGNEMTIEKLFEEVD